MASTPRANLADDVISSLQCAICGADALHVVHVERLPDYVECRECKSAFIMEDGGDRVLYGQMAEGYPQTSEFALRQWAWLEAIETRAREERPSPAADAEAASIQDIEEPGVQTDEADWPAASEFTDSPDRDDWEDVDELTESEPEEPAGFDEQDQIEEAEVPPDLDMPASEEAAPDDYEQSEYESSSLDQQTQPWEPYEAGIDDEGGLDADEPDADAGFDWLSGLADEDTPIEEPDLIDSAAVLGTEAAAGQEFEPEGGLSTEDLDDLFRVDEDQAPETTDFSDADEEPISEGEPVEDEWDWTGVEEEHIADLEEEPATPEAWLEGIEVEGEPEFSDLEPTGESLAIGDEDDSDDFISSLRHSAAIPLESQPLQDTSLEGDEPDQDQPEPPSWAIDTEDDELSAMAVRMQSVTAAEREQREAADLPEESPEDDLTAAPAPSPDDVIHYRENDPPPEFRYRVVIGGDRVVFPGGECAHCGQTPVKGQLAIAGTLPEGQGMGDRKPTRFQIPLCRECRDRAKRLSEDARSARTQSFLVAGIIGMALVVGTLAFNLVDPGAMQIADWLILLIFFVIGSAGSAILLLNRVGNYAPPLDAAYVRTTLLVPTETQGLETAFEWRNNEYAERFSEANEANTLGSVTQVKDRLSLGAP